MPYNPANVGIAFINRIKPFTAIWVGDASGPLTTSTVQNFMDLRRQYKGQVANIAARDALTGLADGDWVEVLDDGTATMAFHGYRTTGGWRAITGSAGNDTFKAPVRAATTANLATTYASGPKTLTATANGAIGSTIDGVALALNDRVLVKNQTTATQNGVYTVTSLGAVGAPYVLTRATDADTSAEMLPDTLLLVAEGTANADLGFILSSNAPITLDTSSLTFVRFAADATTVGGFAPAATATANTLMLRNASGNGFAVQHASLGAAGAAGAVIVADGTGKVPSAALPSTAGKTAVQKTNVASSFTLAAETVLLLAMTAAQTAPLLLPATPAAGTEIVIKDKAFSFGTFQVTLTAGGADTIQGEPNMLLALNDMAVTLYYDGAGKWWMI